jgi:NitT/TauT family transport system substrate-binding protein
MLLRTFFRLLALALALIVPAPSAAQTTAPAPVRIATLGFAGTTGLPIYAQETGIFKKDGIDATITQLNGGGAIVAAISGGSLDVGFSNITSAVAALERGLPIVVVCAASLSAPGHVDARLMKARGSKLRSGADLNGKTIAVSTLGGTLQLGAQSWVDKTGGDSKTVHFLELPASNMAAALRQGRIDAAMIGSSNLEEDSNGIELLADALSTIAPQWIAGVFVASKTWVAANPDTARRFVLAMHETARWANAHKPETDQILARLSGIPVASLTKLASALYTDQLTRVLLQPGVDAAYRYGALKAPFDTTAIVNDAPRE